MKMTLYQNKAGSFNNTIILTQTNDLRTMFQSHGNQLLKYHFLPLINFIERTTMRSICQTIKNNIPAPQYSYFQTIRGCAHARIETNTGFVETFGNPYRGGDSSEVSFDIHSNVKHIVSCAYAFAALKKNGRVITWGNPRYGGDSINVMIDLQSDVKTIISTSKAFAALKKNGRVITWGNPRFGGDSSSVISDLQSDVKFIFSTNLAFAALKTNGRVITWGSSNFGGDSSRVILDLQSDVKTIVSTNLAFAALKTNGRVITWGLMYPSFGVDSSNVSEFLQNNVIQIKVFEHNKFRAIKNDGTFVEWS
jgi:alpha-tubulin suppressor-like RCC1 family protein